MLVLQGLLHFYRYHHILENRENVWIKCIFKIRKINPLKNIKALLVIKLGSSESKMLELIWLLNRPNVLEVCILPLLWDKIHLFNYLLFIFLYTERYHSNKCHWSDPISRNAQGFSGQSRNREQCILPFSGAKHIYNNILLQMPIYMQGIQ